MILRDFNYKVGKGGVASLVDDYDLGERNERLIQYWE